ALQWLCTHGDAKITSHPAVCLAADTVWFRFAVFYFILGRFYFLLTALVFATSQAFLFHHDYKETFEENIATLCCRVFIYLGCLPSMMFSLTRKLYGDFKQGSITHFCGRCFPIPDSLKSFQVVGQLGLMWTFVFMFALEPITYCVNSRAASNYELFSVLCPEGQQIMDVYSILSSIALLIYWFLLTDFSLLSMRVSAFLLVCFYLISEVVLFVLALTFLILAFSTAISALNHHIEDFETVPAWMRALLQISLGMFPNTHYDDFQVEVTVLVAISVFVALVFIFLVNLLIAQLNQAYHNMFEDIYGNARLTRAAVIVQVMAQVPRKRWQNFLNNLAFDQPLEFNEGDVGIAGGIQILEPASAKIVTSDAVKRYGGSTAPTMPWPVEETANLTDEAGGLAAVDRKWLLSSFFSKDCEGAKIVEEEAPLLDQRQRAGMSVGAGVLVNLEVWQRVIGVGVKSDTRRAGQGLLRTQWQLVQMSDVHASFLNAADEAADSNAASMTVEEEGKEVLEEARAAETVAKRAVRFAWGAVFICGIGVSIDIIGASLDYRATSRAKEDLDEEEADLEARHGLATLAPPNGDLEPSQLSQLDSAAPWVLSPSRRATGMGPGASPQERLAQTALTSSYPKLEGLQPEPAPSLTGSVQQVPYQTLLAGQSPRPYYSYTAPPPAPPAMLARGQPSAYVQPCSTSYRYAPSVPSSYREATSNLGSFNVPATPAEVAGAPVRYSLPAAAASSPTRHPGPPTEPVQLPVPLQPAAVQSGEVQSTVVPDLAGRLRSELPRAALPASQVLTTGQNGLPAVSAARAPISLPGVVQNKLAASLATSQLVATESSSLERVEKPAVEVLSPAKVLSPAHGLLRTDLGIQLGGDLPKGLTSPEAKAVPSYAASNGSSSTARSLGSPGRLRSKLPPADEGGSHAAGLSKRLSAGADDVVNTRDRYRGEPKAKLDGFFDCLSCFSGLFQRKKEEMEPVDVILVGGGIMSATTGLLLKQLEPSWRIVMIERLDAVAQESSNAWNNAGTGHSALCEPNYTPQAGKHVDIHKAVTVNENFQLSRQYWAYLAKTGLLPQPERFIHTTPHMTFARGEDQISWLKKRFDALKSHTLFEGMEYSEDRKTMEEWAPLMMAGRKETERCALSRVPYGTDVDFGELTKELTKAFLALGGEVQLRTTVSDLHKDETALYDESWIVSTRQERQCFHPES
ncbi:mqo, partial [Symbiodinium sp. CCMP2456]